MFTKGYEELENTVGYTKRTKAGKPIALTGKRLLETVASSQTALDLPTPSTQNKLIQAFKCALDTDTNTTSKA